jgi:long-chain acyl-CoA synthetase
MSGYWNNPGATEAAFLNGWLLTGDMGFMDASGRLTLRDRSKDVIISGGTNIYPREIEDLLLTCPGVAQVSVIGARDAEWGEIVVAFIVRDAGAEVDEAALDAHCQSYIARFKRPKRYVFVTELPKNSYGKVLKRELAERLNRET